MEVMSLNAIPLKAKQARPAVPPKLRYKKPPNRQLFKMYLRVYSSPRRGSGLRVRPAAEPVAAQDDGILQDETLLAS
jgi:hypothetical protein